MPSFEFIVIGPPFSSNLRRKQPEKHAQWQFRVNQAAKEYWNNSQANAILPIVDPVEVTITTFFTNVAVDVDNVIKPILDSLRPPEVDAEKLNSLLEREKRRGNSWFIIYGDDQQVYRVVSERVDLNLPVTLSSPSPQLASALDRETELVRILLQW